MRHSVLLHAVPPALAKAENIRKVGRRAQVPQKDACGATLNLEKLISTLWTSSGACLTCPYWIPSDSPKKAPRSDPHADQPESYPRRPDDIADVQREHVFLALLQRRGMRLRSRCKRAPKQRAIYLEMARMLSTCLAAF